MYSMHFLPSKQKISGPVHSGRAGNSSDTGEYRLDPQPKTEEYHHLYSGSFMLNYNPS